MSKASVNPEILKWARESTGLDVPEAARRIGVKPERLEAWEAGEAQPTFNQLRSVGRTYRRPSAFFFLSAPPPDTPKIKDFRRLPSDEPSDHADVEFALRRSEERRENALELLRAVGAEPVTFPIAAKRQEQPADVAQRIRRVLALPLSVQKRWHDPYEALREWTGAVESLGVLVFHISDVDTETFRAFSIARFPLPIIALNGKDAVRGRLFSLMHELAHLALRLDGLCDLHEAGGTDGGLEAFCNEIAGNVLVPAEDLLSQPDVRDRKEKEWPDDILLRLSNLYEVSTEVILRRLLTAGKTTKGFYETKREEFKRAAAGIQGGGFLEYYRRVLRDNGRAYTALVVDAYQNEVISARDLSHYLGDVKITHLPKIAEALRAAS